MSGRPRSMSVWALFGLLATMSFMPLFAEEQGGNSEEAPVAQADPAPEPAPAAPPAVKTPLDARALQQRMIYITELEQSGVLSKDAAKAERESNLGRYPIPVTEAEVPRLIWREWRQLGASILYYLAIIVAVAVGLTLTADFWGWLVSALGVIGTIIVAILTSLPVQIYQLGLLCLSGYLMYFNEYALWTVNTTWLSGLGAILFPIVVLWFLDESFEASTANPIPGVALVTAIVWAIAAVTRESYILAFFSVFALQVSVGFSAFFGELYTAIGFEDKHQLNRGMIVSFLTLVVGVVTQSMFQTPTELVRADLGSWSSTLQLFQPGLVGLGAFIFYLALEIKCSEFGSEDAHVFWSFVMFVLGPLGAYLGTILGLPELRAIALSFFLLFLSWKLGYIATQTVGARVAVLGGAIAVCFGAGYVYNHPDSWTYLIRVDDPMARVTVDK